MHWRLNRIQYPIYNLGPGKRIGIWVQGCSIRCQGCVNPSLWTTQNGHDVAIEYLVSWISKIHDQFDGITITGGEPFEQYEALIAFSAFIKKKTGLNIYVFSGYSLEELTDKFNDRLFMSTIDYLMDERYIAGKHENNNIRGSSNQNLYQFENGAPTLLNEYFESRQWSVNLSEDNRLFMSGIPKDNDLSTIKKYLKNIGINMEFA